MCGIAGFVRPGAPDAVANSLEESLARRGPDGAWTARRGDVSLVQTRLAVIDLSPGVSYPMPNESEDVWLLFNGEIYGYEAVRQRLEGLGHRFRTACDAEVVVHAYEEWGAECFTHLNGMFAVAILDERSGDLLLARDRFGIKPLVHTTGDTFAFSSDALSLVESGLVDGAIDLEAVEEFLQFHYVPPPKTGLEGVVALEPGTALVRERGGQVTTVRWAPRMFEHGAISEGPPVGVADLDHALAQAVERQLVADVPVGVFLSSGIDSALLLSYAVSAGHRPLAFTVGFAGFGDYDETRRASEVASRLGVEHHVDQFDIGFADALDLVCRAFDTPLADASAIPTLLLARMARELVTVALSGTGGDELFAGYYRHRAHRIRPFASRLPKPARAALMAMAPSDAAPRRSSLQAARSYLARLASAGGGDFAEQYLDLLTREVSPAAQASLRFRTDAAAARSAPAKRHALGDDHAGRPLDAVQEFDLKTYLPGDVLLKEDRATMYSSLEARVPFLDDAVVDIAQRIPPSERASLFVGKKPLRRLASQRLGAAQLTWQKRGFAVPLSQLLRGNWTEEARSWFQSLESSLVDGRRVCDALGHPDVDPTEIWALAILGAWEQRLADARKRAVA
jgi:asparagine synthase (glutamine-hydrolysing)